MPPRARRITDSFNTIHQSQVIYAIQQAPPLISNDGETQLNTRIRAHFEGMNASIHRTSTSDAISISSDEEEQPRTTAAASDTASENAPPPPVPPRSTRPASKSKVNERDLSSASSVSVPAGSDFAVSELGPSPQNPTGDLTAHGSTDKGKGKEEQPALPSASSTPFIGSEPPVVNQDSQEIDRMLALRLQAALFGEDEAEFVTYHNDDLGYRVKYRSEHRDQPQAGPSNVERSHCPVREENRAQARVQSPASEAGSRVQPRVPAHPARSSQSTASTRSSITSTSTSTSRANFGISTRSQPTSSSSIQVVASSQAPPTSQAQAQRSSQAQAQRAYQAQATVSSQAQPPFQAPPVVFSGAPPAVASQSQAPPTVASQPQAPPAVSSQPHVSHAQHTVLPQPLSSAAASQTPNPGPNHFYPQGTSMPIPRKVKFYAVTRGLRVGVFNSWDEVAAVTQGWNAVFKSYSTFGEALNRYESAKAHGMVHRIDPITRNWILVV